MQFDSIFVSRVIVNTNRTLGNKEADINLYAVLSMDKYELEWFY